MATREEIYTAIRNADKAGDSAAVRKLGAYLQTMPSETAAAPPATTTTPEPSFASKVGQQAGNALAGAVRGAGSIGATILWPYDKARDLIEGTGNPTLSSLVTGQKPLTHNEQRRADMDAALTTLGAQTDSIAFKGGKLAAEIAGTAGTGGAVARGAAAIPGVAAAAPGLLTAIRTAGMQAGNAGGVVNAATRAAGGAITGAASAGLVDPKDAGAGAVIGGALPGAVKVAGTVGAKIGGALRGAAPTAEQTSAIQAARDAGYVIPPTQANPTLINRVVEGFAGKLTTAQNASARNQNVTNRLAAETLGLAPDTKITPDALKAVRDKAGQAYDAIGNAGTITPGKGYADALDKIAAPYLKAAQGFPDAKPSPVIELVNSLRSPTFDASSAVAKIKELRSAADDAFRAGNTDVARASKSAAGALETAIEDHLTQAGNTTMLDDFRAARQLIAKTYSVQKALNPATGSIDARKLSAQLAKGVPLSGGIKSAAEFAARFPKAAQATEGMGSLPQASPLDWAMGGGIAAAAHNPALLALAAARPAARALTLSDLVQNRLAAAPNGQKLTYLRDLLQGGARAAPVLGTSQ